jgi:hypothetical protein
VELQFIAKEIDKVPGICAHFLSAAGAASFQTFFNTINSPPNTVFVEAKVNNAKGIAFGGKDFDTTKQKAVVRPEFHSQYTEAENVYCFRMALLAT